MAAKTELTRTQRALVSLVAVGALVIAGIGFAGSYAAVCALAFRRGFGAFAYVFPIGVDVGIAVLLALDLVLTWMRIPFPLLRQAAWLLTGGTIVFNAATSLGDPLAMGMHAIIPVLFIVVVEATRHAIGRIADITADRYMESVRLIRWILSPWPTFLLWRRMKLWELRDYEETVRAEQRRMEYQLRLRMKYGRLWRRKATVDELLPVRFAKLGIPIGDVQAEDAPAPPATPSSDPDPDPNPAEAEPRRHRRRSPVASSAGSPRKTRAPRVPSLPAAIEINDVHTAALQPMSNADAIRYAFRVSPDASGTDIHRWLKLRGREVNRGQLFRLTPAQPADAAQP